MIDLKAQIISKQMLQVASKQRVEIWSASSYVII